MIDLLDLVAARLDQVERAIDGDSVVFARSSRTFALVADATAEFRLDPVIVRAALRTPDVSGSERGPEWVAFKPAALDQYARDRAGAWFESAWRRAG